MVQEEELSDTKQPKAVRFIYKGPNTASQKVAEGDGLRGRSQ